MYELKPAEIRYSQESISRKFRNGNTLEETIEKLKNGILKPRHFPTIEVFPMDRNFYTINNRRLYCFKTAQIEYVPVQIIEQKQVDPRKLTTNNDGISIRVRMSPLPERYLHKILIQVKLSAQDLLEYALGKSAF